MLFRRNKKTAGVKNLQKIFIFSLFFVFYLIFKPDFSYTATGVPKILNYQGRLLDSSGNLLGGSSGTNYCFKFSFYTTSTVGSGTKLWPSGSPATTTVSVKSGVFNFGIGDTSAGSDLLDYNFQDNDTIYLNVEVGSQVSSACTSASFETLSPRQRITSAGFAINASTVGGFEASQYASGNQIPVLSSGNLALSSTNPQINATSTNTLTFQGGTGTGDIQFFSSANKITSGGALTIAGTLTSGGLTVSGTSTLGTTTISNLTSTNATTTNLYLSGLFNFVNASGTSITSTNATFASSIKLTSITSCNSANQALQTGSDGSVSCGVISGGGAGGGVNTSTANYFAYYLNGTSVTGTPLMQFSSGAINFSTNTVFTTSTFVSSSITSANITNLSVGATLNLPNNSVTDVMVVNGLTIDGGTVNNTPIGSSVASTAVFTSATTTNLFATSTVIINGLITSATSTNLYVSGSLNLPSNSVTDAMVVDTITASNYLPLAGGTLTGPLFFTSASGTAMTSTVFLATSVTSTNASFTTLVSTNDTATNLTATNATSTNLYISGTLNLPNNSVTDAMVVDTITASNYLPLAGGTLTGPLFFTTASGTAMTSTVFLATSITSTNAFFTTLAATNFSPANVNTTNLTSTNANLTSITFSTAVGTSVTTTNLNVSGVLSLPSNSVTDAMVVDTITASNYLPTSASTSLAYLGLDYPATATSTFLAITASTSLPNLTQVGTLANLLFTNTTGTNINITGQVSLPNNSITDAMVVDTLTASNYLPLAGGTLTGPLYFTSASGTAATSTNAIFVNATSTNLYISGTTNLGNTTISNLTATNATSTNLYISGTVNLPSNSITDAMVVDTITASNYLPLAGGTLTGPLYFTSASGTAMTSTVFLATSVTSTNAFFTTLAATNFSPANINTTNLTSTNANLTSITFSTAVGTSVTTTNLNVSGVLSLPLNSVTDAMVVDTITASNYLPLAGGTLTGPLYFTTASGTAMTSTVFLATSVTSTNASFTSLVSTNDTVTNLTATNATTTNLYVSGVLNLPSNSVTDAMIVDTVTASNYLPLAGGTLTGPLYFTSASGTAVTSTIVLATSVTSTNAFFTTLAATNFSPANINTTNVTTTNLAVTGVLSLPSNSVTDAMVVDTITASNYLPLAGGTLTGPLYFTSASGTAVTSTNAIFVNATSTNLYVSGITNLGNTTISNLTATNATSTNLYVSGVLNLPNNSITDAMVVDTLTASNYLPLSGGTLTGGLTFTTASGTAMTSTVFLATSITSTNASFTNLSASSFSPANINTTNLTSTNANLTSITFGTAVGTSVTTTNLNVSGVLSLPNNSVTDAMVVDTLTASNYLPLAGGTLTGNLNFTNASGTMVTSTNILATNATSTNLFATGLTFTNANGTSLTSTNAFFTNLVATTLNISASSTFRTSSIAGGFFQTDFADCSAENQTVNYNATTGKFTCLADDTSGGGSGGVNTSTANYFTFYLTGTTVTGTPLMQFSNGAITVTTNTSFTAVTATSVTTTNLAVTSALSLPSNSVTDAMVVDTITASNYLPLAGGTLTGPLFFTSASGTAMTSTVFLATSITSTNASFTNLSASSFSPANINTTNLTSTNANLTSITFGTAVGTSVTTTNLNVSGVLSLPSNSVTDAMVVDTITASNYLPLAGGTLTGPLYFTSASGTAVTSTSAIFVNASTTNLYVSGVLNLPSNSVTDAMIPDTITASNYLLLTGGTLSGAFGFTTATGTSVTSTNAFFTNLATSNFSPANINTTNLTSTNANLTSITFTNAVGTSVTTTNLSVSTNLSLPNNSITDAMVVDTITASNYLALSGGTLTGSLYFTSASGTAVTSTNILATNATTTNLNVSGVLSLPSNSVTDAMVVAGLTIDSGTINNTPIGITGASTAIFTNVTSSNATSTNLYVSGTTNLGNTTISNLTATNATSTNLYVSGALNLPSNSVTDAMVVDTLTASNYLPLAGGTLTGPLFFTSASGTAMTSTIFLATSITSTNASFTNLSASSFSPANINTTNLTSTNANLTSITFGTAVGTSVTTTNLNVSGVLSLPSNSVTDAMVVDTITASNYLPLAGGTLTGPLYFTSASGTAMTSTVFLATSVTSTNAFFTTLVSTNDTVTNLTATNATSTNLYVSGVLSLPNNSVTDAMVVDTITASNYLPLAGGTLTGGLTFTTASGTAMTSTVFLATSITSTNASFTNLSASSFSPANINTTNLTSTNANLTSITFTTAVGTSVTTTNLNVSGVLSLPSNSVTDAMVVDTITASNYLPLAGGTLTGPLYFTSASGTAVTSTNAIFVNATSTNLYVSGALNLPSNSVTDAMIPDTITASNYLLLTGGTLSGAFGFTTATGTSVTSTNIAATLIGPAAGDAGAITIGAAAGTGLITVGNSTVAQTLSLGIGTSSTINVGTGVGTTTINIGTGGAAGGVRIGATNVSTTILGGLSVVGIGVTTTNLYVSGALNLPSNSVTDAMVVDTITASNYLPLAGGTLTGPLYFTSASGTSMTSTNAIFVNATSTNLYVSGALNLPNNSVTDAMVVDTITASNYLPLAGGTLTGGLTFTTASGTAMTSTVFLATSITSTNASFTNLSASSFSPANINTTNLTSTNANLTSITFGTAVGTSVTTTNLNVSGVLSLPSNSVTDAMVVDTITASNYLPLAGGTLTGPLFFTTASGTAMTSTVFLATSVTSTNASFTTLVSTNDTVTNLTATNATSTNLYVSGVLNLPSNSITDAMVVDTIIASNYLPLAGGTLTGPLYFTSASGTAVTSTNLLATNATTTNLYVSGVLNLPSNSVTDAMVVDTITASNYLLLTGGTLSGAFGFTTATGTSVTSTNAFFTTLATTNFSPSNISTTNVTTTNLNVTGALTLPSNSVTDAMVVDTITASNYLPLAGGTLTGPLFFTSASGTSMTSTNAIFVNASTTNLYVSGVLNLPSNSITDAMVVDTITASNYLPLAGGTLTGALYFTSASGTTMTSTNLYVASVAPADGATGAITIGASAGTGLITLGNSSVAQTVSLGIGTSSTINIGTGAGTTTIAIGTGGATGTIRLGAAGVLTRVLGGFDVTGSGATTTNLYVSASSTFRTSTVEGGFFQTSFTDCSGEGSTVNYNATTGKFTCLTDGGGTSTATTTWDFSDLNVYLVTSTSKVGIGTNVPSTSLHIVSTTEQLRLGYNSTNYASFTVASNGGLTITPSGNATTTIPYLVSTSATSTNLYISGTLSLPNNSITDAMVVDTVTASNYLPLAGGTLTGPLYFTVASGTTMTSTNLYVASVAPADGATGAITIGAAAGTGLITVGNSTVAQTLSLGIGTSSTINVGTGVGTTTINIGTGGAAGGVRIGATNVSTTILGGLSVVGIGATTTNLYVSGSLNLPSNSITDAMVVAGLTIDSGTINNTPIGASGASTAIFTNVTSSNATSTNLYISSLANFAASSTMRTTTINGGFFMDSFTDCSADSQTVNYNATTGKFTCLTDSGGSSAYTSPITVTDGTTTSSLRADGLFIATSTSNLMGLFFANSAGSISTSGTLRVFATSTFTTGTFSRSIGIGTTTPTQALSVVGNISNILDGSGPMSEISSITIGSTPTGVSVAGKYAYVVAQGTESLYIVDISDPRNPVQVGTAALGTQPFGIYVAGRYAYVTLFGAASVITVDISNPVAARKIATTTVGANPRAVYVAGKYAYVANRTDNNISVLDISNPLAPIQIATTDVGGNPFAIYGQGRYVYTANNAEASISVVDVSNPYVPLQVSTAAVGVAPNGIYVSGKFAYVTNFNDATMSIVDISNPASPVQVGTSSTGVNPNGIFVSGRYAYVANETSSTVSIIDVSSSTKPTLIKNVTAGNGSASIYVSGRYAYTGNVNGSSMSVLDLSGTEVTSLIAHSAEFGNLQSLNDVIAQGNIIAGTSLLVGAGGIQTNGALSVFASSTNATSSIFRVVPRTGGATSGLQVFGNGTVTLATTTISSSTMTTANITTLNVTTCNGCGAAPGGSGTTTWTFSGLNVYLVTSTSQVGIGTNVPSTTLHVVSTTEQLRLGYNSTNYASFTVASNGGLTISPSGNATTTIPRLMSTSVTTTNFSVSSLSALSNLTFASATGTNFNITNLTTLSTTTIAGLTLSTVTSCDGADQALYTDTNGVVGCHTVVGGGTAGGGVNTSTANYFAYYLTGTGVTGTPFMRISGNTIAFTTNTTFTTSTINSTTITNANITNLIVGSCTGCGGNSTSTFDIFVSSTAGNGTWTAPAGVDYAQVIVTGGGGAGGSADGDGTNEGGAGGGGAGGTSIEMFTASELGANQTIVVGAAGAAAAAAGGGSGGAGGTTTFGAPNLVGANPGQGGTGYSNGAIPPVDIAGGAGGAATTSGDVNLNGAAGHDGFAGVVEMSEGGIGGASYWGGGGTGGQASGAEAEAGTAATAYGAGGGGAASVDESTGAAGGNGASGVIVVISYNSTGGDLAEWYEATEDVVPGDLVSISSSSLEYESYQLGLSKTSILEKAKPGSPVVGVVSTIPFDVMGGDLLGASRNAKPIALAGRVPVNVSNENGPVKAGDMLTISSVAGVAMRATKSGVTIGRALQDAECVAGLLCKVMVLVNTSYFNGIAMKKVMAQEGLDLDTIPAGLDVGRAVLTKMIADKQSFTASTSVSEIYTDRVMAGLEIITPRVVTQNINVDTISSLSGSGIGLTLAGGELFSIFAATTTSSTEISSTTPFVSSTPVITFDNLGNGFFAGKLTANEISANQIFGLNIITDKLSSLADTVSEMSASSTTSTLIVEGLETNALEVEGLAAFLNGLKVAGLSMFNGDVTVVGKLFVTDIENPLINSITSSLQTIAQELNNTTTTLNNLATQLAENETLLNTLFASSTATSSASSLDLGMFAQSTGLQFENMVSFKGGLQVDSISSISGATTFMGDSIFFGRPYFNADSGGFVVMSSGTQFAEVVFEREYLAQPVISVSISLEASSTAPTSTEDLEERIFAEDIRYLVTKKSATGFTIKLNKPAPGDIVFSWIALAVKDAKIVISTSTLPIVIPVEMEIQSTTPAVIPIETEEFVEPIVSNTTTTPIVVIPTTAEEPLTSTSTPALLPSVEPPLVTSVTEPETTASTTEN